MLQCEDGVATGGTHVPIAVTHAAAAAAKRNDEVPAMLTTVADPQAGKVVADDPSC